MIKDLCVGSGQRPVLVISTGLTFSHGRHKGRKVTHDRGECSSCHRNISLSTTTGLVHRHSATVRTKLDLHES